MIMKKPLKVSAMAIVGAVAFCILLTSTAFAYSFGTLKTVTVYGTNNDYSIYSGVKDTAVNSHDGSEYDMWAVKVTYEEMAMKPKVCLYKSGVGACSDSKKVGIGTYEGTGSSANAGWTCYAYIKPNTLQTNEACQMTLAIDAD